MKPNSYHLMNFKLIFVKKKALKIFARIEFANFPTVGLMKVFFFSRKCQIFISDSREIVGNSSKRT